MVFTLPFLFILNFYLNKVRNKLIDKGLDISSLKSQSQNQLRSVADSTSFEGANSKPNATREERKKVRQEKSSHEAQNTFFLILAFDVWLREKV